jgi:hypothetical protein
MIINWFVRALRTAINNLMEDTEYVKNTDYNFESWQCDQETISQIRLLTSLTGSVFENDFHFTDFTEWHVVAVHWLPCYKASS